MITLGRTALYDRHVALGAKITDFAGWEMPVQYRGVMLEHRAVREQVGIFDVSHMGRVFIEGADAERYLDYLSTNVIAGKRDGIAIYTVFADADGGSIDDAIIYRYNAEKFCIVVNAGNRQQDLAHFQSVATDFDVTVRDQYATDGILAVQGPSAAAVVGAVLPEATEIKPMRFVTVDYKGEEVALARTGYTGSNGFEIASDNEMIVALWDQILAEGAEYGIEPIGLGARDTLRLEAGFALYGHELSREIGACESVSAWTVKFDKADFLGKEALKHTAEVSRRHQYGAILLDRGIARQGYPVLRNGEQIGSVTSGTHAPTLDKAIAIVMVEDTLQVGDKIEIQIRDRCVSAEIVKLPFYSARKNG
ncbi:Aminomethyltransferase [Chlamydiales bacterium SCGC AG-110-P3]|nr:Aminomethyltransferase [Chlamydiales bacterium SCGC AG-110-P3]